MTYTARLVLDENYEMPESDIVVIGYRSSRYTLGTKNCREGEMEAVEASDAVWLPVYAYVHSGATISTKPYSCPWDSGQSGIAWISRRDALQEWGNKVMTKKVREKAEAFIKGFIKEYDQALQGDIYGYVIESDGEEVGSLWGIFGREYAEKEMNAALSLMSRRKSGEAP